MPMNYCQIGANDTHPAERLCAVDGEKPADRRVARLSCRAVTERSRRPDAILRKLVREIETRLII